MMTEAHTPGPWKAKPGTDKLAIWDSPAKNAKPSGTLNEPMILIYTGDAECPHGIAYVWGWYGGKEAMQANARLIAAAPDLLAALEDIENAADELISGNKSTNAGAAMAGAAAMFRAKARAALAKAK